jgi:hypothetical protein
MMPLKHSTDIHKDPKKYYDTLNAQMKTYYNFAKTSKTEYQLDSLIDKLSLVRESQVKAMNGEENWAKFLVWLKTNGAKVISTTEDGVPTLSGRQKSPYEPISNSNN